MAAAASSLLLLVRRRTGSALSAPALTAAGCAARASISATLSLLSPGASAASARGYHRHHLQPHHASAHRTFSFSRGTRCQKRYFKSGGGSCNARRRRFGRLAPGSSGHQSANGLESKSSPVHSSPSSAGNCYGAVHNALSPLRSSLPGISGGMGESSGGDGGGGGNHTFSSSADSLGGKPYKLKSLEPPAATLDELVNRHYPARFLSSDAKVNIFQCTISPVDNPFPKGLDDSSVGYFVHDAVKKELRALGRSLVVPGANRPQRATLDGSSAAFPRVESTVAKADARTVGDVIGDIPSSSGRIIVLASPFKGGEINAETVALALASELKADFLPVCLEDIFQRFSPTDVQRTKIEYKRPPKTSHGKGMPDVPLVFHQVITQVGSMTGADRADGAEGWATVPAPWYREYHSSKHDSTNKWELLSTKPLSDDVLLIGGALQQFIENVQAGDSFTPKVVFFRDLFTLMRNAESRSLDIAIIAALARAKRERPIIFILPSAGAPPPPKRSSPMPFLRVMGGPGDEGEENDENADDDEGEFEEYDEDMSNSDGPGGRPGGGGGGGGGESGGGTASEAGRLTKKLVKKSPFLPPSPRASEPLSFAHPLDAVTGVITVPLLPPSPSDRDAYADFRRCIEGRDRLRLNAVHNLRELEVAARFAGMPLDFKIARSLDGFPVAETIAKKLSANLLRSQLPQAAIERILTLAVGLAAANRVIGPDQPNSTAAIKPVALTLQHIQEATAIWDEAQAAVAIITSDKGELYTSLKGMDGEPIRPRLSSREKTIMRQCLVLPGKNESVSFDDIGGLEQTKTAIREVIELPLKRPELFSFGALRRSTTGILLFGPPGTGKTMLAKAVAAQAGANFLSLEMNQIQSMWVGEAEKNIRAVFGLARKIRPCVVFVDEVDALLGARGPHMPRWASSVVNDFMQQWDGVAKNNDGVIVVAATNRPFDLDDAVLRRLPRRILVNLPDDSERVKILSLQLEGEILSDDVTLKHLAKRTKGYSGSDLKNVAIAAALNAIREQNAKHDSALTRTLHLRHFEAALKTVVPSIKAETSDLMKQLHEWNAVYGTGSKAGGIGFV